MIKTSIASRACLAGLLAIGFSGAAAALSWPDDARNISRGDFIAMSNQHWVCELFDGHPSFADLEREYYFENIQRQGSDATLAGTVHTKTLDRGTIIAQGFSFRGVNRGAAYLRRDYVYDDNVRFRDLEGDNVSFPMKVSRDGERLYPGTFKDVDDEFQVGILQCQFAGTDRPNWVQ